MALTPWKGRRGTRVEGSGPLDAKVVLLAEAPGSDEEDFGVPLIGKSGSFLFDGVYDIAPHIWPGLKRLGLGREVVRCENVIEVRPLDNDLESVSWASMEKARVDLQGRLSRLTAMALLVPMGNCALNAILQTPLKQRKKRGGGKEWKWPQTISAWRGSVNEVEVGGRRTTMIPTFHPATFLWGGGSNFQAWRGDWARVARAAVEGIEVEPKLTHVVGPTHAQLGAFVDAVDRAWRQDGEDALLALDIETIGPIIDCIGLCVDGKTTLTIPLLPQLWPGGKADVRRAWEVVRGLVEHAIPKGTHFGYYDVFRLERQKGWKVKRWWWDSYDLSHLCDPADERTLAYCVSRHLHFPYWKHENVVEKKRGTSQRNVGDWRRRNEYCGKDVGVTWHEIRWYQAQLRQGWEPTWESIG